MVNISTKMKEDKEIKVWICFDVDLNIVGVYSTKDEAYRHMLSSYLDLLSERSFDVEEIKFDLRSMLDNDCIEEFFYIEEHTLKKNFIKN